MKRTYNLVLTILTIILLIFMSFYKLNAAANWIDMSGFAPVADVICNFGPMVLLCMFAFGSILISKVLFVIILILLIVFAVCMFAPSWLASIFGTGSNALIGLGLRF